MIPKVKQTKVPCNWINLKNLGGGSQTVLVLLDQASWGSPPFPLPCHPEVFSPPLTREVDTQSCGPIVSCCPAHIRNIVRRISLRLNKSTRILVKQMWCLVNIVSSRKHLLQGHLGHCGNPKMWNCFHLVWLYEVPQSGWQSELHIPIQNVNSWFFWH